jgi:hypothetical protein
MEDGGDAVPTPLRIIENSAATTLEDISGGFFGGYHGALYDIDVWYDGSSNWVLAACDLDVLALEDAWATTWIDFDLIVGDDEWPAYEAKFAPDFDGTGGYHIWAVTEDGSGDFLFTATTLPAQWGFTIEPIVPWDEDDNPISASRWVDMEFVTDYNPEAPEMFIALGDADWGGGDMDLGNGNLYYCEFAVLPGDPAISYATPLITQNIDMCSVEVSGDVILAGALQAPMVYRSDDYGYNVLPAMKQPTGWGSVYNPNEASYEDYSMTNVAMAPGAFDPDNGVAYVATVGAESAVSRTMDGGETHNQIAWWDTSIDDIRDIAHSADFPSGSTILMLTAGISLDPDQIMNPDGSYDTRSLWRTSDDTAQKPTWERVQCGYFDGGFWPGDPGDHIWPANFYGCLHLVEYSADGSAVYLFGHTSVNYTLDDNNIWKSTDNAQTFAGRRHIDTVINEWAIPTSHNIFAATSQGYYRTDTSGLVWHTQQDIDGAGGPDWLVDIALQPGFSPNPSNTILVGDNSGNAYVSTDGGALWGPANDVGSGNVFVAFDAEFDANATVYTATNMNNDKIKTAKVSGSGQTAKFATGSLKDLKDSAGSAQTGPFTGLQVADDNALYAMHEYVSAGGGSDEEVEVSGMVAVEWGGEKWEIWPGGTPPEIVKLPLIGVIPLDDVDVDHVSGHFMDDELVVHISGVLVTEGLSPDFPYFPVVSGTIGVMGSFSGATGDITLESVEVELPWVIWSLIVDEWTWPLLDFWEQGIVRTVVSTNLIAAVTAGTEADVAEAAGLWRLLLHESDNIWEFEGDSDLDNPDGLWLTKPTNVLWTIDDSDEELWVIEDTCSGKVTQISPADGTLLPATSEADLEWEAVNGAKKYDVKYDSTWLDPPTSKTTTTLTGLTAGTSYDWKVRVAVGQPWHSRWSSSWEFSMAPMAPVNEVPANGAQNMPLLPSFGWTAVPNAISYDFELGTAADFSGATQVSTTVTFLTWETELLYDTNYYWRVRAVTATGVSAWCESNFHTRVEPMPPVIIEPPPTPTIEPTVVIPDLTVIPPDITVEMPPAPDVIVEPPDITIEGPEVITVTQVPPTLVLPDEPEPGTPVYIWVIVAIGAVLTIAVIVLIIRTRRVV